MASGFAYLRTVDPDRLTTLGPDERYTEKLLSTQDGVRSVSVSYVRTPPAGGSPAGLHTHEVEQVFYILSGTMEIEVAGETFSAGPGSLVVFPAGVPHRNWNAGDRPVLHLNICAPAPEPDQPFARPVE
jgi:mannose-6-phosphate isomerase-like protein (cupin superfamily)